MKIKTWGYARTHDVERLVNAITSKGGIAYAPFYMAKKRNRSKTKVCKIYPFREIVFFKQAIKRQSYNQFVTEWNYDCIFQDEIDIVQNLNDSGAYNEAIKRANELLSLVGSKQTIESPIHPFQGFDIEIDTIDTENETARGKIEFMGKKHTIEIPINST